MTKIIALIYKDILLLVRDRAGMLFLFAMPLVLVLVMTGIQYGAVENASRKSFSLLLLNGDDGEVGKALSDGLGSQDMFVVTVADSSLTAASVQSKVREGSYLIGVCIPEHTTEALLDGIECGLGKMVGLDLFPGCDTIPPIELFFDPTVNASFRAAALSCLREVSSRIEREMLLAAIAESVSNYYPDAAYRVSRPDIQTLCINEVTFSKDLFKTNINVTEHNVPAWTLFAIFFIIISLSGGMIKERNDGSFSRLLAMSCSYSEYLLGKTVVYEAVCLLQFLLVVLMGRLVFPLVGLPAFTMHGAFALCLATVFFCALAAIGIGLLLGTLASTHQQSSVLGAVIVVVLSAIGGIWVPTFLMPHLFEVVSVVSPLNWGIDAFYDVMLRGKGLSSIIPNLSALLGLAIVCTAVSVLRTPFVAPRLYPRRRKRALTFSVFRRNFSDDL